MIRGGAARVAPWLSCLLAEWARRLGASPPKRMAASWFGSIAVHRMQGRGAMLAPDGELPSDRHTSSARPSTRRRLIRSGSIGGGIWIVRSRRRKLPCHESGLDRESPMQGAGVDPEFRLIERVKPFLDRAMRER